jgi:cell volume regulation protein A
MAPIESLLLLVAVLLLLGVVASKTSGQLGVPALLLFLVIGMLAGSEGPGGIEFDDPWLAQALGVVALIFILFAGGLDTEWRAVRPVLWHGFVLSALGVLVTGALLGAFLHAVVGYSWLDGLLLGAIVSSTDAAAVFAILRARNVRLPGRLRALLELESGSNDPMAVFLTMTVIRLITSPSTSVSDLIGMFALQMTLGAGLGYGLGRAIIFLVNRVRLEYEGLYPVLTLSLVLLTYGATTWIGGNGFLAVYLAGLVVGNSPFVHKRSLLRFHDGLAWLMQITMFLTLGLLVFPSRLASVIGVGLLMSAFLILVARPVSVFVLLAPARMTIGERTMVAWTGLRGAVPIVLATFPLLAGVPGADHVFHLVFFVVLSSVLLQGTSIPFVARWLGLDEPEPRAPGLLGPLVSGSLREELAELLVSPDSPVAGRPVVDLGFPEGALIVLMRRQGESLVPGGTTVLRAGDTLLVLADREALDRVRAIVERPASR